MVLRGLRNSKKRLNQVPLSGMKRLLMVIGQAKIACQNTLIIRAGLHEKADRAHLIAYLKSYLK